MRFGQAVSALLARYGVDTVFGIPGVHTIELFRDIERFGIVPVVPRHEQGAGFMADGYARISGRPGVCYLVTGPGVLNALTPIAQAWHDSVPMLVIASTLPDPESRPRTGALHETPDLAAVLAPFTSLSVNVRTIDELAAALDRAFRSWAEEAPKPVFIGIPIDVLGHEVDDPAIPDPAAAAPAGASAGPAASATTTAVHPDDLERAARMLEEARRPVLLVGGGARRAGAEILALAEVARAPIVLTGNAKGLLPDSHPLCLGTSLRSRATRRLLAEADLVVMLGAQLSPIEYTPEPGERFAFDRVLRVDLDPRAHPAAPAIEAETLLLRADAGDFARRMAERIEASGRPARDGRATELAAIRAAFGEARAEEPMLPWIEAVRAALPERACVAVDSAHLAYQSHMYLELGPQQRWLAPYGLGTLGPALPMAIGARIADPAAAAIAIAGDGGCLFTLPELATARDLDAQLTYLIWDNRGYHEIRRSFERVGARAVGVDTSAEDLAAIARGFGAEVHEVGTPGELEHALESALRSPRLSVVVARAG